MAKGKGNIKGWITKNGVHIPIYDHYTVREGHEPENVKATFKKKLPKYSNDRGVITNDVVEADSRYGNMSNIPNAGKFRAREVLRTVMQLEERGEKSGSISVLDSLTPDGVMFKDYVNAHKEMLKQAGYKVTSRTKADSHTHGYQPVKAGSHRVYASTSRARVLHFEKIEKELKGKMKRS